jgi:hypothetical protein
MMSLSRDRIGYRAALALGALVVAMASHGGDALACAVCGAGQDDPTNNAFLLSTALLSLIPFGMISGTVYWLYRTVSRHQPEVELPHPLQIQDVTEP